MALSGGCHAGGFAVCCSCRVWSPPDNAYVALFVIIMLIMMLSEQDQITAFSAVAATMNNLGPGLGDVSSDYAAISPIAKYLLCLAMVLGRLEIFTLLVLLTPAFWRS